MRAAMKKLMDWLSCPAQEMERMRAPLAPYSIASWYLWRSLKTRARCNALTNHAAD
jgi:3-methyladenine DNA glycosylase/8-oxoguanine DNA glycosylase